MVDAKNDVYLSIQIHIFMYAFSIHTMLMIIIIISAYVCVCVRALDNVTIVIYINVIQFSECLGMHTPN